jgi:hypothetical protein
MKAANYYIAEVFSSELPENIQTTPDASFISQISASR